MRNGVSSYRRVDGLAWQWVAGEGLILDIDRRVIRGVNPVGFRIWELLDGTRSLSEIVEVVGQEYPEAVQQLQRDVEAFVAELASRSLIEPV